jgi:hypothetical protein
MDKSALLADRVRNNTDTVEIDGVGTVTVRALSRKEMIEAGELSEHTLVQERYILSRAMIDPQMSEDDIAAWQAASPPGEINRVADKVNELSGLKKESAKRDVPAV